MHNIEKQMSNDFYQKGKYLDKNSHIILNDICAKIQPILIDFDFLKNIDERLLRTHIMLNIPQLSIEKIYKNITNKHTLT